jgi:hypothetical protein
MILNKLTNFRLSLPTRRAAIIAATLLAGTACNTKQAYIPVPDAADSPAPQPPLTPPPTPRADAARAIPVAPVVAEDAAAPVTADAAATVDAATAVDAVTASTQPVPLQPSLLIYVRTVTPAQARLGSGSVTINLQADTNGPLPSNYEVRLWPSAQRFLAPTADIPYKAWDNICQLTGDAGTTISCSGMQLLLAGTGDDAPPAAGSYQFVITSGTVVIGWGGNFNLLPRSTGGSGIHRPTQLPCPPGVDPRLCVF